MFRSRGRQIGAFYSECEYKERVRRRSKAEASGALNGEAACSSKGWAGGGRWTARISSVILALIVLLAAQAAYASDELEFGTQWGKAGFAAGDGPGEFNVPFDVAADSNGHVYVTDYGNRRIQKFDGDGNYLLEWTMPAPFYPFGIAVDPEDRVYVADVDAPRIRIVIFDGEGTVLGQFGEFGSEPGQLREPNNLAFDRDGILYVADSGNNRVTKFGPGLNYVTHWGSNGSGDGQFSNFGPSGIAVDADGFVYVADMDNHRVQKFDSNGVYLAQWGEFGSGDGQFNRAQHVAVDHDGDIYVTDFYNGRLQKFDNTGQFLGKWGHPEGAYGSGEGEFRSPRGIAVSTDGTLYVADTNNYRIQSFKPLPSDADLLNLQLSGGVLDRTFHANTTYYRALVPNEIESITVTPAAREAGAAITVNGVPVDSGSPSGAIAIAVGANAPITIQVEGASGRVKTYTIEPVRSTSGNASLGALSVDGFTLDPVFDPDVAEYSVYLDYDTHAITVTASTYDPSAVIRSIHGNLRWESTVEQLFYLPVGHTPMAIVIEAENGTEQVYTLHFHRGESSNADLYWITLFTSPTDPDMEPAFHRSVTAYSVTVANTTDRVSVTATVYDPGATIKLNGEPLADNTQSDPIPLTVGENTIEVEVTSPDGTETKTYTIQVTRDKSANADLRDIEISSGSLFPATVVPYVTAYSASVGNEVETIAVTPHLDDETARVTVNGEEVESGTPSENISLQVGDNAIVLIVTAENELTTKTYTVTITRAASGNADLRGLGVRTGEESLALDFAPGTISYAFKVPNAVESVTVIPETDEPNASVQVNGIEAESGEPAEELELSVGVNWIEIVVTAQNGIEKKYWIKLTRTLPGSGTEQDPFLIADRAGLAFIQLEPEAHYRLEADIDMAEGIELEEDRLWEPIVSFSGGLDGAGHVIANLRIDQPAGFFVGMFSTMIGAAEKSYIRNIVFRDAEVSGSMAVGIVAGYMEAAEIRQVRIENGKLSAVDQAGGLVGLGMILDMVEVSADIEAESSFGNVGGLLGGAFGVNIERSYASGSVSAMAGDGAGGLVGVIQGMTSTIADSYSEASVSGGKQVGGLVGLWDDFMAESVLVRSYASGPVSGEEQVGGLVGKFTGVTAEAAYYLDMGEGLYDAFLGEPLTEEAMAERVSFIGWDFDLVWSMQPGPYPKLLAFLSGENRLGGLALSAGALTPAFSPDEPAYTAEVGYDVETVAVTPTLLDSKARVAVEGAPVLSGAASPPIALDVGDTVITVMVTSELGTTRTYTITIQRLPSDQAELERLELSEGELAPTFEAAVTEYEAQVGHEVETVRVTAAPAHDGATVKANGEALASGEPSDGIELQVGVTLIEVEVTAQDGETVRTYRIAVTREGSGNAELSVLELSEGELAPTFEAAVTEYTAQVGHEVETVRVTAAPAHDGATVKANGEALASGEPSDGIELQVGVTLIEVEVTAQDGETVRTYRIAVTRSAPPDENGGGDGDGGDGGDGDGGPGSGEDGDGGGNGDGNNGGGDGGSSPGPGGPNGGEPGEEEEVQEERTGLVDVILNGVRQELLPQAVVTREEGRIVTRIALDSELAETLLEQAGTEALLTVLIQHESERTIFGLNGQMVKLLEFRQAELELRTGEAGYRLPAEQMQIDAVARQLGDGIKLEDIAIYLEISPASEETAARLAETAARDGFTVAGPPLEFRMTAVYNGMAVEIDRFTEYVARTIVVPETSGSNAITTGVAVEEDGTVRHVPTQVYMEDGRYMAVIHSLTNSTYALVHHQEEFADLEGHWARETVHNLASRLIIQGVGGGLYSPDTAITRAEFSAILVRALGLRPEVGAAPFTDVDWVDWFSGYLNTALSYNLVAGYADGTFRPDEPITREQAMVMLARAMALTGLSGGMPPVEGGLEQWPQPYTDLDQVSDWAAAGIVQSLQAGLFVGRSDSRLAPAAFITRAETAAAVQRLLQRSGLI